MRVHEFVCVCERLCMSVREEKSQKKSPVSVKFLSAILGPEMAAPILWAPGKIAFFLQENPMPIKFAVLGGGVFWVCGGGVGRSADFIFMGARIFLKIDSAKT